MATYFIPPFLSFQEQAEKEALKREQEEQKQREELEEFQKKMKGKRRKPRVRRTEELEPTFLQRYRWLMLSTAGAVVLAVFVYWLLGNWWGIPRMNLMA